MSVPPTLSPEQHKLWASCPDAAHRAVAAVVAELGAVAPPEEMLAVAVHGTLEAAVTYDAERGGNYADWALFYAALRVWEWVRGTQGTDQEARSRIRTAMFRFLAHDQRILDPWAARETSRQVLRGFSDGLLMAGYLAMDGTVGARGEDDLLEIEAAAHTGRALRKVTEELPPEQRRLLDRCIGHGETIKVAALETGKGYRAVLREYHEILARMGTKLGCLGIDEMPPWRADVSGEVFPDPEAPDEDDESG